MASTSESIKLTLKQRHGRAINAVAELLRNTLSVPNIYLEPPSKLIRADVLAVDRAGAGDLYAVEIKLGNDIQAFEPVHSNGAAKLSQQAKKWFFEIQDHAYTLPTHYRYLAIPSMYFEQAFEEMHLNCLIQTDGIGRLGIITVTEHGFEPPVAKIMVSAERFRLDPVKLQKIETNLLSKTRPDIEVRI